MKTTIQILYDKGLFDNYANADKILAGFFVPQDETRGTYIYLSIYTRVHLQLFEYLYICFTFVIHANIRVLLLRYSYNYLSS